jgi:hypothetical protein
VSRTAPYWAAPHPIIVLKKESRWTRTKDIQYICRSKLLGRDYAFFEKITYSFLSLTGRPQA